MSLVSMTRPIMSGRACRQCISTSGRMTSFIKLRGVYGCVKIKLINEKGFRFEFDKRRLYPSNSVIRQDSREVNFFCRRSFVSATNATSASNEMEVHGVVPDVIDQKPANDIEVKYPSGAVVSMGNELTPTQVKDRPSIKFAADASKMYSFCMTDPDAPSRADPKNAEWLHWLVGNVPGGNVDAGEVINDYVGSGPPQGSGLHRYVFLAYEQPAGNITFDEPRHSSTNAKNRNNFKIREFARKYNLGQPVAGNFYQAQWDDYVPKLYAQFKE